MCHQNPVGEGGALNVLARCYKLARFFDVPEKESAPDSTRGRGLPCRLCRILAAYLLHEKRGW